MNSSLLPIDSSLSVSVGVLSLQGAFLEHLAALKNLQENLRIVEVKTPEQLEGIDGLIIPGGESTVISSLAARFGLLDLLKDFVHRKPVFGTCAGLILISDQVTKQKIGGQNNIGGLAVTTERNVYGTQLGSFTARLKGKFPSDDGDFEAIFIRAPGIKEIHSPEVEILASLESPDGVSSPVAVRQGHLLATTFHPELTDDLRWHKIFTEMIRKNKQTREQQNNEKETIIES